MRPWRNAWHWVVYEVEQIATGRRYVGLTRQAHARWLQHHGAARRGVIHPLYLAMRDAGPTDFVFRALYVTWDELHGRDVERATITAVGAWYPEGFNLRPAGRFMGPGFRQSLQKET